MRLRNLLLLGGGSAAAALVLTASVAGGAPAIGATPGAPAAAHHRIAGTLDARHLPAVLPHGVFRVREPGSATAARTVTRGAAPTTTTNGLIISDMAIYVSDGSTYTNLAAEGHLDLTSNDGGQNYVGTFVDDLSGATVYWASATGIQPTGLNGNYRIDTGNGTMTFSIGTSFTSTVPAKYGSNATIGTILYGTHAWTAHAPLNVTLNSFDIGTFHQPVTGTLMITTDAIGYIVPFFAKGHVNSSFSYFTGGHAAVSPLTAPGRYFPPDGAGDGSLSTILSVGRSSFSIVNATEDTSGQKIISGDAYTGTGSSAALANFTAH